jgi:hypothetical protein
VRRIVASCVSLVSHTVSHSIKHLLLIICARLQNLAVVFEALRLVLLGRGRGLELYVGITDAEDVGGHYGLCMVCLMFDRFLRVVV